MNGESGIFQQFGEFPMHSDLEYRMAAAGVLMTVAAIAVPVFSDAPKAYLWLVRRHIVQLYRDLRVIERERKPDLSPSRLAAFLRGLERIDHATSKLPMRHSDLFFALQTQIGLMRARLEAALAAPQPADA